VKLIFNEENGWCCAMKEIDLEKLPPSTLPVRFPFLRVDPSQDSRNLIEGQMFLLQPNP
jgi:hypothetical protein